MDDLRRKRLDEMRADLNRHSAARSVDERFGLLEQLRDLAYRLAPAVPSPTDESREQLLARRRR